MTVTRGVSGIDTGRVDHDAQIGELAGGFIENESAGNLAKLAERLRIADVLDQEGNRHMIRIEFVALALGECVTHRHSLQSSRAPSCSMRRRSDEDGTFECGGRFMAAALPGGVVLRARGSRHQKSSRATRAPVRRSQH